MDRGDREEKMRKDLLREMEEDEEEEEEGMFMVRRPTRQPTRPVSKSPPRPSPLRWGHPNVRTCARHERFRPSRRVDRRPCRPRWRPSPTKTSIVRKVRTDNRNRRQITRITTEVKVKVKVTFRRHRHHHRRNGVISGGRRNGWSAPRAKWTSAGSDRVPTLT